MIPLVDKEICVACGKCVEVCPPQAITLIDNIVHLREELCGAKNVAFVPLNAL